MTEWTGDIRGSGPVIAAMLLFLFLFFAMMSLFYAVFHLFALVLS